MVVGPEHEELLLLGVPVAADPAEAAGPVVQSVRQDADARLGVRNDAPAEEGVTRKRHGRPPGTLGGGFSRRQSTFRVHLGCMLQVDIKMDRSGAANQ